MAPEARMSFGEDIFFLPISGVGEHGATCSRDRHRDVPPVRRTPLTCQQLPCRETVHDAGNGRLAQGHVLGELGWRQRRMAPEDAEADELWSGQAESVGQVAAVQIDRSRNAAQRYEDVFF